MRKLFGIATALLVFVAGCGQQNQKPLNAELLITLHNQQRSENQLKPLVMDSYLADYAQKHAQWMASRNWMKHSNINNLVGKYRIAGENIAWNQTDETVVTDAWMHSKPHRHNILNKNFTKVGFGMARNSKGQPYWCTNFGD